MGMVCEVKQFPSYLGDEEEFGINFYHEYYYSLAAECDEGTIMFSIVDHYRETMERFEAWKQIVAAMGGGEITIYRLYDKYVDDEDYEPDVEAVFYIYDDDEGEEYAVVGDEED